MLTYKNNKRMTTLAFLCTLLPLFLGLNVYKLDATILETAISSSVTLVNVLGMVTVIVLLLAVYYVGSALLRLDSITRTLKPKQRLDATTMLQLNNISRGSWARYTKRFAALGIVGMIFSAIVFVTGFCFQGRAIYLLGQRAYNDYHERPTYVRPT